MSVLPFLFSNTNRAHAQSLVRERPFYTFQLCSSLGYTTAHYAAELTKILIVD